MILAKKILVSVKQYRDLKTRKFDKPIVFSGSSDISHKTATLVYKNSAVYRGKELPNGKYILKIFDPTEDFSFLEETVTIYSIGNLTKLSYIFNWILDISRKKIKIGIPQML